MAETGPPESSTQAFLHSLSVILVSEIGDKTFLLAAILAMRHPRMLVFAGALGSLIAMSILSAGMGHVLPALLPRKYTQLLAALLFVVFGARMLQEGRAMQPGNDKIAEEMREAEEEIEGDDAKAGGEVVELDELEAGTPRRANGHAKRETSGWQGIAEGTRNFFSLCFGPVVVQAFVLTFLAEWGDRSQIATIALGAAHNVYLVTIGTIIGHSCCTAVAVVGGRWVSTKISVKHVTLAGAVLFLLFGVIYFYEALSTPALPLGGALPLRPDDPDALLSRR